MISVGEGQHFQRIRVRLSGKDVILGPASSPALLRYTVQELSSFIDGGAINIPSNTNGATLFEIAKQLASMIVKNRLRKNGE